MRAAYANPLMVAKTERNVVNGAGPWLAAIKAHCSSDTELFFRSVSSEQIRSLLDWREFIVNESIH